MKRVQQVKPIGIAAAMMLFVVVSMFAMGGNDEEAQYLLSFDVNPSMEIEIGEEEKVLKVHAVNDEAKELQLEALEGEKVEEFLDAYLEKMTEKGYMNNESAKVLLSYADLMEDEEASEELINQVTDQMQEYFAEKNLKVDINTLAADHMNLENARSAGISLGKFQLIEEITLDSELAEDSEEAQEAKVENPEESEEGEELKDKSVGELLDHPVFEMHPRDRKAAGMHPVFDVHPKNWDREDGEKPHPVFDEHPGKRGNEDRNDEENEADELDEEDAEALEFEEENRKEKDHPIFEDHPRDRDKENKEHPVFDEHPRDRNRDEDRDDNDEQQGNEDDDEDEEWDEDKEHPIFDEHPGNRGNREEENSDSMRKGGN